MRSQAAFSWAKSASSGARWMLRLSQDPDHGGGQLAMGGDDQVPVIGPGEPLGSPLRRRYARSW